MEIRSEKSCLTSDRVYASSNQMLSLNIRQNGSSASAAVSAICSFRLSFITLNHPIMYTYIIISSAPRFRQDALRAVPRCRQQIFKSRFQPLNTRNRAPLSDKIILTFGVVYGKIFMFCAGVSVILSKRIFKQAIRRMPQAAPLIEFSEHSLRF